MSELNSRFPWRVEWVEYPSGYHNDRQFVNRESAENFFSKCLTDREFLESLHSVALQYVDFVSPGVCFVYSIKVYRNHPENERRVKK